MRTSFIHVADTGLGYADPADPGLSAQVAKQFRHVVDHAVEQRAAFVVFSGNLFDAPDVEPDAFQAAYRGLRALAEKNVSAIAVRGRRDMRLQPGRMSWYDMLAQEGLLAVLEPQVQDVQLALRRWERRDGRGSYLDLGRCRVFGLHYMGTLSGLALQALAKAVGSVDNREVDYKVLLLHGSLEHFSHAVGPQVSYSDLLMLRRSVDYVALGGCDETYEAEGWAYNPGPNGFYQVTVDTAVEPKHHARYVAYPPSLAVSRPQASLRPPPRRVVEERIFEELLSTPSSVDRDLRRDVLRLVTQAMWGAGGAGLEQSLLELAHRGQPGADAA
ncbi:MAG TPA: hypothetical protein VK009_13780 [Chloroflexota bacterium]|nr:hypothetical protein [Chloroflexota bacterium]